MEKDSLKRHQIFGSIILLDIGRLLLFNHYSYNKNKRQYCKNSYFHTVWLVKYGIAVNKVMTNLIFIWTSRLH